MGTGCPAGDSSSRPSWGPALIERCSVWAQSRAQNVVHAVESPDIILTVPRGHAGEAELSLTKRESSPMGSAAEVVGGSAPRNANAGSALKRKKNNGPITACREVAQNSFAQRCFLGGNVEGNGRQCRHWAERSHWHVFFWRKAEGAAINCFGALKLQRCRVALRRFICIFSTRETKLWWISPSSAL